MMDTAQQCLQEADGLAAVLDPAYAAFEVMLSAIHPVQDPASSPFAAFAGCGWSLTNMTRCFVWTGSARPIRQSSSGPETAGGKR